MKRSMHLCSGLLASLLLLQFGARASAQLVVAEPQSSAADLVQVSLTVSDDGFARLPLKWKEGTIDSKDRVDIAASTFKGSGQDALVGLGIGPSVDGPLRYRVQQLEIGASGVEILLDGSGLAADVDYLGQVLAIVGQRQKLNVKVTLVRPAAMMPFRCPLGVQIVHQDGSTVIDFPRLTRLDAKAVDLKLSPFRSTENEWVQVGFATPSAGQVLQSDLANVALTGPHFVPPLRAVGLTEGTTYSGRLGFFFAGRQVVECPLDLMMPKQSKGELAVDSTSLTRNVTLPIWPWKKEDLATVSLRLFDKTRMHRVDNITAVLDGLSASPNGAFDPVGHASFWVNESKVPHFMQLKRPLQGEKTSDPRTILAGEQLNIEMRFDRLDAGNHTFGLRFVGGNGAAPSPKVDVALNVRHHWSWALAAVFVSVALFFYLTKGVVYWRERIRLRRRVAQLKSERFDLHNDIPCVAFLHLVLNQTTLLLEHTSFLTAPPTSVNEFLARAERVVTVMRRYSAVQEILGQASCGPSVKDHYREAISAAMSRIGPQPLDQATAEKVVQDLDLVASHLAEAPYAWFRTHLSVEAKNLAIAAREVEQQLGDTSVVSKQLLEPLEKGMPAEDKPADVKKFNDTYWIVKLLLSRRKLLGANDVMIEAYTSSKQDVDKTFKRANEWGWDRLKDGIQKGKVRVEPLRGIETQECLTPITFVLRFDDDLLDDGYFASNVLRYTWTFDLPPTPPLPWWRQLLGSTKSPTTPNSQLTLSGTRVTQYATAPGAMKVSVTISLPGHDEGPLGPITSKPLQLQENSELKTFASLSGTELVSMALVLVLTFVTTLQTLYFGKPTFGSFGDYAAILAWAFGFEQLKNLSQLLKSVPLDPPPTGTTP